MARIKWERCNGIDVPDEHADEWARRALNAIELEGEPFEATSSGNRIVFAHECEECGAAHIYDCIVLRSAKVDL